jgi:hypothetical protein
MTAIQPAADHVGRQFDDLIPDLDNTRRITLTIQRERRLVILGFDTDIPGLLGDCLVVGFDLGGFLGSFFLLVTLVCVLLSAFVGDVLLVTVVFSSLLAFVSRFRRRFRFGLGGLARLFAFVALVGGFLLGLGATVCE